jgi:hypothetical protein
VEIVDVNGERRSLPFEHNGRVVLPGLRPGDNAWVGVTLPAPSGKVGELFPVTFHELVDGKPVNGFTIAPQISKPVEVFRANVELQAGSFLRATELMGLKVSRRAGNLLLKYAKRRIFSRVSYFGFLKASMDLVRKAINELLATKLAPDSFGLKAALADLAKAQKRRDIYGALNAHTSLAHKLDAYITMLQKSQGDLADIMQTVSWQSGLFATLKDKIGVSTADRVTMISETFVADYQSRKVRNTDYPKLVSGLIKDLKVAADGLGVDASAEIDSIQANLDKSLSSLQKAHHDYLLKLFGVAA